MMMHDTHGGQPLSLCKEQLLFCGWQAKDRGSHIMALGTKGFPNDFRGAFQSSFQGPDISRDVDACSVLMKGSGMMDRSRMKSIMRLSRSGVNS